MTPPSRAIPSRAADRRRAGIGEAGDGEPGVVLAYGYTVKDIPAGDRPRERLLENGAEALSNAELLAIILRTGIAGQPVTEMAGALLARFGGLEGIRRASVAEMCAMPGLGAAKAAQIQAALELGRRLQIEELDQPVYSMRSPEDVAAYVRLHMPGWEQEHLMVVLLDNKHRVVDKIVLYKGNVGGAVVRMAELFRDAIRQNCPALVLAHNHPSGEPAPSAEDLDLTSQAIDMGKQLDIKVLDHIVLGRQAYKSLRREGLGLRWQE